MNDDPFEDPRWLAFAEQARKNLIPKVKESALSVALITGADPDPKLAIEVGYMILLDKPIIVSVSPGSKVPENLAKVADEIVEFDMDDLERSSRRMREAIARVAARRGL